MSFDTTFGGAIEKCYRRLLSNQMEMVCLVAAGFSAGTPGTPTAGLQFSGPLVSALRPGVIIAIDYEVFLVTAVTAQTTNTATITAMPAYSGSTAASHSTNALCYIAPKFTRWDIWDAINNALNYLSSPEHGLFTAVTKTITYIPTFQGYDLGAFPANFIRMIEFNYDIATPTRNFPDIRKSKFVRGISNTKIPSGRGIVLYEAGWAGLNMNLTLACPFTNVVNATDDLVAVAGMLESQVDIPALCAEVDLTIAREIKRNFIESQPDPKTMENVPPGAMTAAVNNLLNIRDRRISEERERLYTFWPDARQRP